MSTCLLSVMLQHKLWIDWLCRVRRYFAVQRPYGELQHSPIQGWTFERGNISAIFKTLGARGSIASNDVSFKDREGHRVCAALWTLGSFEISLSKEQLGIRYNWRPNTKWSTRWAARAFLKWCKWCKCSHPHQYFEGHWLWPQYYCSQSGLLSWSLVEWSAWSSRIRTGSSYRTTQTHNLYEVHRSEYHWCEDSCFTDC